MATLYRYRKDNGLYLISDGPLGKYTGRHKIARPYNRSGNEMVLDFNSKSPKFTDFEPVADVNHNLGT